MTIALVGTPATAANAASGASIAIAATSHTTGNTIVVNVGNGSGTVDVQTVTDTAGNLYTPLTAQFDTVDAMMQRQFYCLNCVGNASNVVTATFTGAATNRAIHVAEFSHSLPVELDGEGAAAAALGSTSISFTVVPTAAADEANLFYLADSSFNIVASTNTVGAWTNGPESSNDMLQWYKLQTGTASLPSTFTFASDARLMNWLIIREVTAPPAQTNPIGWTTA